MKTRQLMIFGFIFLSMILLAALLFSQPDTVMPALNGFLMIGLGLIFGFLLNQRFGLSWSLFGAGALTFIGSQVLHIPFNRYLLNPLLAKIAPRPNLNPADLVVWGILLGLSAGLFEETARYLVLKFWRKDVRSWKQSLMFGSGHGGIEAIIVGILAFLSFLQLFLYRQLGTESLTSITDSTQVAILREALQTFWSYNWYQHLWGSLERFSAISIHLSATVLVYQSIRRNNLFWYLGAVLWHALVDFFAVYAASSWGIPLTEAILFGMGILSWGVVFLLKDSDPPAETDPAYSTIDVIPPAALPQMPDKPITKESLEESRYD